MNPKTKEVLEDRLKYGGDRSSTKTYATDEEFMKALQDAISLISRYEQFEMPKKKEIYDVDSPTGYFDAYKTKSEGYNQCLDELSPMIMRLKKKLEGITVERVEKIVVTYLDEPLQVVDDKGEHYTRRICGVLAQAIVKELNKEV